MKHPKYIRTTVCGRGNGLSGSIIFLIGMLLSVTVGAADKPPLGLSMELERPVLPANQEIVTVLKINLEPASAAATFPLELALVLDRSATMQGARLDAAKKACRRIAAGLRERDSLTLVSAGEVPITHGVFQHGDAGLAKTLEPLSGSGQVNLFAGLSQGAAELRSRTGLDKTKRLILITAGENLRGPRQANHFRRLGIALRKEGIAVTCIGLGYAFNEDLLTALAEASGGNTYFLPNPAALSPTVQQEVNEAQEVFALNTVINLDAAQNVQFMEILGLDARLTPGHGELQFNQLSTGKNRYALIQVRIAPRAPGEKVALATAELRSKIRYLPEAELAAHAMADFIRDTAQTQPMFNTSVQNAYSTNIAAVAYDESIELFDQGKKTLAVETLLRQAKLLRGKAALTRNEMMRQKAIELEGTARQLQDSGLTPKLRKTLRIDSYQSRAQQGSSLLNSDDAAEDEQ